MIGTIEALGVFLLAVLPGFVTVQIYSSGQPSIREAGALHELGTTIGWSLAGWVILYGWLGQDLLPKVLDRESEIGDRLDAFGELAVLAIAIGILLGLSARLLAAGLRAYAAREERASLVQQIRREGLLHALWFRSSRRLLNELRTRTLPIRAWDRLFARLSKLENPVMCRIRLCDGSEVLGVLARDAYADWTADGGDLLLAPEVGIDPSTHKLVPLPGSRGVFVPRDQIAVLSVAEMPSEPLSSPRDA